MRVLFLTHSYPSSSAPLNFKFIKVLAKQLARRGIEVFVVVPRIFLDSPYYECDEM